MELRFFVPTQDGVCEKSPVLSSQRPKDPVFGKSRDPLFTNLCWIPAFAGMTTSRECPAWEREFKSAQSNNLRNLRSNICLTSFPCSHAPAWEQGQNLRNRRSVSLSKIPSFPVPTLERGNESESQRSCHPCVQRIPFSGKVGIQLFVIRTGFRLSPE
jgi:hypothetical protein